MVIALGEPWRLSAFLMNLRGGLVTRLGDEGLQHLPLMIDRAPEVAHLTVDADVDLVQVPSPMGMLALAIDAFPAYLRGEHGPEARPPEPHGLMADVDAALVQQVLDVTQRQRVANVHQHHQPDHLGRAVEPAERVGWLAAAAHVAGLAVASYRTVQLR